MSSEPSSNDKLRYLHLSDLHFSPGDMKGGEAWAAKALDQNVVTKAMLKYVEELNKNLDFIIVTGDIAQSGKREEYEVAEEFFLKLRTATNLKPENIFAIPGNHDLDRSKIKEWHLKAWYGFENQREITKTLSDEEALEQLMRKFAAFNDFAAVVMGRRLFKETTFHMVDRLRIEKAGREITVALAGLNSALFAGYDDDDKQNLALGLKQVDRALDQLGDKEAQLSIGFFHHPFECFHKEDDACREMLKDKLDLILTGHTHEPGNAFYADACAKVVQVGAGAGFEKRKSENSFNIVEIDLKTGQGSVEFHKYLHRFNKWNKNFDMNLREDDRTFKFEVEKIKESANKKTEEPSSILNKIEVETTTEPQKAKTHFIHTYNLPSDFTGRKEELSRIEKIVSDQSDPVTKNRAILTTVRAIGGMGKSCLIRQLVENVSRTSFFRHIIWFSFYEARTEDLVFFFDEVLECFGKRPSISEGKNRIRESRKMLCNAVQETPILLILDGLEVIQNTENKTGRHYGEIVESYKEIKEFLSRICSQRRSSVVVTSRVSLKDFNGVNGYVEIPLKTFSSELGGEYLGKLGVEGKKGELEKCAKILGGYVLSLKAAGIFMELKSISANEVKKVVGDPEVFEKSTEGEKINKLYTNYLNDMSEEQKYFLERMSIHLRSVTPTNFPVLVKDYDVNGRDESLVKDQVIDGLIKMGLIEIVQEKNGLVSYSAHPLMKVAFASTMDEGKKKVTHEEWAKAVEQAPNKSADDASKLEDLQPYLDAIDHYLQAQKFEEAWRLFQSGGVNQALYKLSFPKRLIEMCRKFELAMSKNSFDISTADESRLYNTISINFVDLRKWGESLEFAKKALNLAEEAEDEYLIKLYIGIVVQTYSLMGEIDKARKLNTENKYSLGFLEVLSGNFEKGAQLLEESILEASDLRKKNQRSFVWGYSLMKAKKITEAEKVLLSALEEARENNMLSDMSYILFHLVEIELKKSNPIKARSYQDERRKVMETGDSPWEEDPFLLIAEKRLDEAIYLAKKYVSTRAEEKINKKKEIESLLALSQAWYGKQDNVKACDNLECARSLMNKTGCWLFKDILEETESLLAS
jgi:predicted MPP superfamily phosphohydrolase